MAKSLRMITFAVVGLMAAGNMTTIAISTFASRANDARITEVTDENRTLETRIAPLGGLIKDIEIDVVQVQQFLQDYAATRAEDGLDDGLNEAAKAAAAFATHVADAGAIAR